MTGQVITLAKWFMGATELSEPSGKFDREEILGALYGAKFVALRKNEKGVTETFVQCPLGRAILTPFEHDGTSLIEVDFIYEKEVVRARFWMNKSSLVDLGQRLRDVPRKSVEAIVMGVE